MTHRYLRIRETEWRGAIYWLLRAYQSGHREGWEAGENSTETLQGLWHWLCNRGFDPNLDRPAKRMLQRKRPPR